MPHVALTVDETNSAADYLPEERSLESLRDAASFCKACNLWTKGTRTVFGEGARHAGVMLVGEQPGDIEDQQGHPFVGPAGHVLDLSLEAAGIDRKRTYVTNAVKHFNWEETRGQRRVHKKPNARQMAACRPWLEAEIQAVRPRVIVALGATAAQSLLDRDFKLTKHRGEAIPSEWGAPVVATVHPSSILRAPTDDERRIARDAFVDDLRRVAGLIAARPAAARR
jgi:DNA polymerase